VALINGPVWAMRVKAASIRSDEEISPGFQQGNNFMGFKFAKFWASEQ